MSVSAVRRPRFVVALLALIRRHPRLAVLAFTIGIGGLVWFADILIDVRTGGSEPLDRLLLDRAHRLAQSSDGNWMTPTARALSWLGNWQGLVPLGALLLWRARRTTFGYYALACAGCAVAVLGLKHWIARPRPQIVPALDDAPFASFPSGHAMYALVAYGFVAVLIARNRRLPKPVRWLAVPAALALSGLIGASRIYLATHYPSDVAAGFLLGVPWLLFVLAAMACGEDASSSSSSATRPSDAQNRLPSS